jgi:hypothetical protein
MHMSNPAAQNLRHAASSAMQANVTPDMCPRMYWRSVNPALPPPESLACLGGGPDCCVTSAVADVRRAA